MKKNTIETSYFLINQVHSTMMLQDINMSCDNYSELNEQRIFEKDHIIKIYFNKKHEEIRKEFG